MTGPPRFDSSSLKRISYTPRCNCPSTTPVVALERRRVLSREEFLSTHPAMRVGFVSLERLATAPRRQNPNQETIMRTEARIPRINEPAPAFEAKSTHGTIKLSDYTEKGKWVLLFSHPADFTPVCTTEFVEFTKRYDDFERLNVQLI